MSVGFSWKRTDPQKSIYGMASSRRILTPCTGQASFKGRVVPVEANFLSRCHAYLQLLRVGSRRRPVLLVELHLSFAGVPRKSVDRGPLGM